MNSSCISSNKNHSDGRWWLSLFQIRSLAYPFGAGWHDPGDVCPDPVLAEADPAGSEVASSGPAQLPTKFKQFEIATQGFSVEDREPFGSDMRTLSVQLDMLGRRMGLLHDRYVEIRETVGRLNKYRAQAMIGAPFFVFQWLGVRRSIGDLHKEIRRIKAEFNALQSSARTLARQGWEAAEKVRRVVEGAAGAGHPGAVCRTAYAGRSP